MHFPMQFGKMRLIYKTIFLLLLISNINAKKLTRMYRLEVCGYSKNAPFILRNIEVINPEGQNVRLSLSGTIFKTLVHPRLEAVVIRCLNKEALDTCEPFAVLKPLNTCELMIMRNMAWTSFIDAIQPRARCPIKKGDYVLTNGTIDGSLFTFFPIDNYYWRVNLSYYVGKEYVKVCTDIKVINVHH